MQPKNFFWVVGFDYPTRLHHGSTLRYVNYAREFQALGHKVYFGVQFQPEFLQESREWFAELRQQGVITEFFELDYRPSPWYLRAGKLLSHPSLANRVLKRFQAEVTEDIRKRLSELEVGAVIISDRNFWFLMDTLKPYEPLVLDVCDCVSLYLGREIQEHVRSGRYGAASRMLRNFLYRLSEDRYYGKRGNAAIVVSPVDQEALARISGARSHVKVLLNGVTMPPPRPEVPKLKSRLIFSGNMNFPPNYNSAVWFLDRVFPRVLEQVPDAQIVLAGANPPESLQNRASANVLVTGYVEDLNLEIARSSLYVAPLITGGGFKNKIVEAIVNHTYVVASPLAVEFLDQPTRALLAVADSPEKMAELIVQLLRDPESCASRLGALYEHVTGNFTWTQRAAELLEIIACSSRLKNQVAGLT